MGNDWDVNAAAAAALAPAPAKTDAPAAKTGLSLKDKLKGYANAATYLNPFALATHQREDPAKTKAIYAAGMEGLKQRDVESDIPEVEAMNVMGKYGPAAAATLAFPPAAVGARAASMVPAAVRAIPYGVGRAATGLAGLSARMAAGGAEGGLSSLAASTAAGDPNVEGSLDVAKDFAMGEGISKGVEKGAAGAWGLAKGAGNMALEQSTKLYSGTPKAAWNTLRNATEPMRQKIADYAKQGMEFLPGAKEDSAVAMRKAQEFGRAAQSKIDDVSSGASKEYGQMMTHLAEDVSDTKFDVAGKVYDRMEPYIKSQGATLRRPTGAAESDASKVILDIYGEIKSSLKEGMAPADAAEHLQRLTAIQRNNPNTSAASHAKELKKVLIESLPGEYRMPAIDSVDQSGWSIGDTREKYRAAKQVQRETRKFTNAETPVSTFGRIIAGGGKTGEALKKAMGSIKGLGSDITEMETASAGAAFAQKIGNLPRTGLIGNAITGLTAGLGAVLGGGPVAGAGAGALLQAPLVALGVSPRLAMKTYLAASKGATALEKFTEKNASKFPPIVANALRASREKKDKK